MLRLWIRCDFFFLIFAFAVLRKKEKFVFCLVVEDEAVRVLILSAEI